MFNIYNPNEKFPGNTIRYTKVQMPGGEVHVTVQGPVSKTTFIRANLRSPTDIMELLMVTDALKRRGAEQIHLICPYFPYARQDRVSNPGEALSVKVMADLINSQHYTSVEVWDAHSDVTPALLHRCKNVHVSKLIPKSIITEDTVLVAPDYGAAKKVFTVASVHGGLKMMTASKHRDTKTGEITETVLNNVEPNELLPYKRFLIVDDICDGGKTFIELAKVIRRHCRYQSTIIDLFTTHGIYSRGVEMLFPYLNNVYTVNSWVPLDPKWPGFKILKR